jgi:organic radical activating enzyme
MKANEIITETINLSQYKNTVENIIKISANVTVKQLVQYLKSRPLLNSQMYEVIQQFIILRYRVSIEENMTTFINQFTNSYFDKYITDDQHNKKLKKYFSGGFEFDVITEDGLAYPYNTVAVNEKFYNSLYPSLVDYVVSLTDELDLSNAPTNINVYVAESIEKLWNVKQYASETTYPIRSLSRITIHELTHVSQHLRQQINPSMNVMRPVTDYRSYLAKSKQEFYDAFKKDSNGNYIKSELFYKLHASSPQEVASHAHDLAITILTDLNLDNAQSVEEIEKVIKDNTTYIKHEVHDFLKSRGLVPTTKTEYNIFKRYLKLVYLELMNYKEYLKSKLSKTQ